MTAPHPTREELVELLKLARRLPPPDHRQPEAFHILKDELIHRIRRLAERVGEQT